MALIIDKTLIFDDKIINKMSLHCQGVKGEGRCGRMRQEDHKNCDNASPKDV